MYPRLILGKGRERRQYHGHPWVYEGEIARVTAPIKDGAVADCYSTDGVFLGRGYYNSRSKIRLRVLTRQHDEEVDEAFLRQRLILALQRRQRLYPEARTLRLVHAEGDNLPGLTVDRYEDVLVMQCTSLGMDQRGTSIAALLQELTGLAQVYVRNDLSVRRNDGLEPGSGFFNAPFPTVLHSTEHGLQFEVDVATGHKTGLYLDQMDNHLLARSFVPAGGVVLDTFCYNGAFALHAAAAGAGQVLGVDSSEAALALAQRNASLNDLTERCQFVQGNVFDYLRNLQGRERYFDVIVLDPPSFTHHREAVAKALHGYKEINLRALKLIRPGGLLLTFTCSYYVDRLAFETMLTDAGNDARRQLIVRHRFGQAAHHPEVMSIPETSYLKGVAVEVW